LQASDAFALTRSHKTLVLSGKANASLACKVLIGGNVSVHEIPYVAYNQRLAPIYQNNSESVRYCKWQLVRQERCIYLNIDI